MVRFVLVPYCGWLEGCVVVSRDHGKGRRRGWRGGSSVSAFFSLSCRDGFRYFHTALLGALPGGHKGLVGVWRLARRVDKGDKDRLQTAFAYLALHGSSRGDAGALPFGCCCELSVVLALMVIQSCRTATILMALI